MSGPIGKKCLAGLTCREFCIVCGAVFKKLIGYGGVVRPSWCKIQVIDIPPFDGLGLDVGGVGACLGFGQGKSTRPFTARQAGKVLLLLFRGPVDQDSLGPDTVIGGNSGPERNIDRAEFFHQDAFPQSGYSQSPIFFRDG